MEALMTLAPITPVPPFPGLRDWENLISFRPSTLVQAAMNARFQPPLFPRPRILHAIEDGFGPVNLDYYPVRVSRLPTSGGTPMQAPELLEQVRRNLNDFVKRQPDGCEFNLYEPLIDTTAWLPLFLPIGIEGAVLSIDINLLHLNAEDGAVVLSESATDHWTFSTLWTPSDLDHPVSGNRRFGFSPVPGTGELIFYTRGADRVTTSGNNLIGQEMFEGADRLWTSFQERVAAFVNANGGAATVEPRTWNRYGWPAVQQAYFHPTVIWL